MTIKGNRNRGIQTTPYGTAMAIDISQKRKLRPNTFLRYGDINCVPTEPTLFAIGSQGRAAGRKKALSSFFLPILIKNVPLLYLKLTSPLHFLYYHLPFHERGKSLETRLYSWNILSVFSQMFRIRTVSEQSDQECRLVRNFRRLCNFTSRLKRHGFTSNASVTLVPNHPRLQSEELQVTSPNHYVASSEGGWVRRLLTSFYLTQKEIRELQLAIVFPNLPLSASGIRGIISDYSLKVKLI